MTTDERFGRAVAAHQAGRLPEGEAEYRGLLAQAPDYAPAWCNLGALLAQTGRVEEAVRAYQQALRHKPDYADAAFNLANAFRRLRRLPEAARLYRALTARAPGHVGAWYNLALTLAQTGDLEPAREAFARVLQLQPDMHEAANHLGDALHRLGKLDEAVAVFRGVIARQPNFHRAYHNLALTLAARGETAAAIDTLRDVLRYKPDYAEAENALGVMLEGEDRPAEALECYRRSLALRPDGPEALNNLGGVLAERGDHAEALDARRQAAAAAPDRPEFGSNLLLAMHYPEGVTPEQTLAAHREWAARFAEPLTAAAPPWPGDRTPDRPLRVGILSPDFRSHTVAAFLEPLIAGLKSAGLRVHGYASVQRPDAQTKRFRAQADEFRLVANLPDAQLAERIREDKIDLLIDTAGHTAGSRLLTLARRPAAVQLTHFGYPDTSGMSAVDYRVTDATSDPPGNERFGTEKLMRLPEVPWCWRPPADAPAVTELPSARGGGLTFGSLNNPAKLTPTALSLWAEILQTLPDAKLVVLAGRGGFGAEELGKRLAELGADPTRVRVVPRQTGGEYRALYSGIDIALDAFPYNGGVTSCDALWQGVPVLTVAGRTYHSRQGAMLMGRLGLGDFVAAFPEQLIALAYRWAGDPDGLAAVRASLRDRMRETAIVDADKFGRQYADMMRGAWREFCG